MTLCKFGRILKPPSPLCHIERAVLLMLLYLEAQNYLSPHPNFHGTKHANPSIFWSPRKYIYLCWQSVDNPIYVVRVLLDYGVRLAQGLMNNSER